MNLLTETIECLQRHAIHPSEVRWCGSEDFGWFDWTEFVNVADVEYDDGFGAAHVAFDLLIVGDDWWMARSDFDGAEQWEFYTRPQMPRSCRVPVRVVDPDGLWPALADLNGEG